MTFAEKLATLRARKRLSQGELGACVGVQQSRISKWEMGEGSPSLSQALCLARELGVPLDYLADDASDEPPPPADPEMERLVANARALVGGFAEANRRILNY